MKKIILNRLDYIRITKRIEEARHSKSVTADEAERLSAELESAIVVDPDTVPGDVVTMNSIVRLTFLNNKKELQVQIVYPDQADLKAHKISIFSPIATALIGYRSGDEIEWLVPGGMTRIRIDEIIYQPEAAGDYDL